MPGKSQRMLGHVVLPETPRGGRPTLGFTSQDTDVAFEAASVAFYIALQSPSSHQHAHQPSQINHSHGNPKCIFFLLFLSKRC